MRALIIHNLPNSIANKYNLLPTYVLPSIRNDLTSWLHEHDYKCYFKLYVADIT